MDIWHKKNYFYKTCEDPDRTILSMKLSDLAQIEISIFKEVSGRLFESTFKIIQSDNILMQKTTLEKNSDKLRPSLAIIYHWSRSLESGLIFLKIRKTNWQYLVVNFLCKDKNIIDHTTTIKNITITKYFVEIRNNLCNGENYEKSVFDLVFPYQKRKFQCACVWWKKINV